MGDDSDVRHEQMRDELTERVNKNYSDYLESLEDFGKSELIEMASKTHAVSDAYSYMTMYHEFDGHELEYFLQFQNPLEVVADECHERNIDVGDISYRPAPRLRTLSRRWKLRDTRSTRAGSTSPFSRLGKRNRHGWTRSRAITLRRRSVND